MSAPDRWFSHRTERPFATLRLICFPYAGGGVSAYRPWSDALGPDVEVRPVQLPGRESRLDEPCCTDLDALVHGITNAVSALTAARTVLFGYSMGALLAFEVARELRRRRLPVERLIVAAAPAPHLARSRSRMHELPDAELTEALRDLGGTPDVVFDDSELLQVLLPILRADFTLLERYRHKRDVPLACPISALGGRADALVSAAQLGAWRAHTQEAFDTASFPAGHFFMHACGERVRSHVAALLHRGGAYAPASTRVCASFPSSP